MSSPLRDLSGYVLGAYHLISLIQSGGMADVYLGERSITGPERQFQHRVAIKVLSQVDDDNVRRFGREMEILLTLHQHHPNIVRVLDYATADGGPYGINGRLHYIVMDYLPGGTLADYMAHHSMTVKRFLVVLSQVADALDAAHQAGVIHRDIKPSNIMFDRTGNAYLTDFGVAKLAIPNPDTRDQTAGQILGTVAYMAPEMFDRAAALTPKADIYSLGVVTYLILGGQLPFDGNQPTPALIKAIYLDAPPLLSDVNPHISPRVAVVVQKAIARDPQTRYATSGEFVRALRDSFESTAALSPIAAPPELERMALGSPETLGGTRAKRWRGSRSAFVGCLLLVALVIGGVLAWQTNLFEGNDRGEVDSVGRVESVTATTPATTVAATATATATATAAATATETATAAETATPAATVTATAAKTATPAATVTEMVTAQATVTAAATAGATATATATAVERPTATPTAAPTASFTPRPTMVGAEYAVVSTTALTTNGEYAACYDAAVCDRLPTPLDLYVNAARSQQPIQGVSWHAAQTYCEWWGGRLPTELEWQRLVQLNRVQDEGLMEWVTDDLASLAGHGDVTLEDAIMPVCRIGEACVGVAANESAYGEALVSFRCVRPPMGAGNG